MCLNFVLSVTTSHNLVVGYGIGSELDFMILFEGLMPS